MKQGSSEFKYIVEQSEDNFYFMSLTLPSSTNDKDYIPIESPMRKIQRKNLYEILKVPESYFIQAKKSVAKAHCY